jgi:phosphoribosylformylglycinamidine synthase
MVGLIEDVKRVVSPGFKNEGDVIALLGTTQDDLSRNVPLLDLERELAVQKACLEAAEAGLLISAHDCSDGGLAVTLAESSFSSLGRDAIGAEVDLKGPLGPTALLFSETPSRIVVTFASSDAGAIQEIAQRNNAPFAIIGRVGGTRLMINVNGSEAIDAAVSELEAGWRTALSDKLQTELVA